MGIILAILLFSFIVFFHELGHFALAKKNGIDVEEFAIGMGPILFSKEFRGCLLYTSIPPQGMFCDDGCIKFLPSFLLDFVYFNNSGLRMISSAGIFRR